MNVVTNSKVANGRRSLAGGLSAGINLQSAQRGLRRAKDEIHLNCDHRLFIPKEVGSYEVVAASVPGRSLDAKILKRSFAPLSDYEVKPGGKIYDNSPLRNWATIASILYKAEAEYEKSVAEKHAEEEAQATEREIDKIALAQQLKEIETAYFGDEVTKAVPTKNRLVDKVAIKVATEALVVRLDAKGVPDWENAQVIPLELSAKRAKELYDISTNPDYCKEDDNFIEIGYNYKGKDRQEAGRNSSYQGISTDTSLRTKFPELWKQYAASKIELLSKDDEGVEARNPSFSTALSDDEIIKKLVKHLSTKTMVLTKIDLEDDMVKRNAKVLIDSGITGNAPSVHRHLLEIVNAQAAEAAAEAEAEEISAEQLQAVSEASTLTEIAAATGDFENVASEEDGVDGIDNL